MSGKRILKQKKLTIGMDPGDRLTRYYILDQAGDVLLERCVPTTKKGMNQAFGAIPRSRVAPETGVHSPWDLPGRFLRQDDEDYSRSSLACIWVYTAMHPAVLPQIPALVLPAAPAVCGT